MTFNNNFFKKFFSVLSSIVFVMLFIGTSYALWTFDFDGEFNVLDVSSVNLEFLESDTEVISLDNAIPISDDLGKLENSFDFMVRTETSATMSIGYNLVLEKLEPSAGYSFLRDDEVKIYLTDDKGNVLLEPTLISEISGNYVIYKKLNVHNSEIREIKDNYKLRIWIDESVTSDRINEESKLEYKFKIGVKTSIDSTSEGTYKVTYNANGGTGDMSDSTLSFNELESLDAGTFTRDHYNFIGWSLKPNGEVIYSDNEEVSNITDVYNGEVNLYAVWEKEEYTVDVVVQNGVLEGESSRTIPYDEDAVFNLTSSQGTDAIVSCTNNQVGIFKDYVLTVENVSSSTVCTVNFVPSSTVLYADGTFIINEKGSDRESNITLHGEVVKEYEPFSATQSYVFGSSTSQPWHNEKANIINVEIGQEIKPMNMKYWFYNLVNMENGDFTKLNTSLVTDMNSMFQNSGSEVETYELTGLNKWNTSMVSNMYNMFGNAGKVATSWSIGDLSNWDVSSVENMISMFFSAGSNAAEWDIGDLSIWDVSNVTSFSTMFRGAGVNSEVWVIGDLSNWDTSSSKNMSYMFYSAGKNATSWSIGDLSNWDVSNVTNMSCMFQYAGFKSLNWNLGDLSSWDVSKVTNMSVMFYSAGMNAEIWNIGNLSRWNTSSVTNMSNMFYQAGDSANSWNIGNLSNWNVSNVTNMGLMFYSSGSAATEWYIGDLSNWDVSSVTNMSCMFSGVGTNEINWSIGDLSNWDVSGVTSMYAMFYGAGEKSNNWYIGDLSNWDVSSVTNMESMFRDVGASDVNWSIGDLSDWNVSNVENMSEMFYYSGESVKKWYVGDLSEWDVSKVKDMNVMFAYSGKVATEWYVGDISKWNTSSAIDMEAMFQGAGANANYKLDLSGWKVPLVTNYSSFNVGVTDKITPPVWVN